MNQKTALITGGTRGIGLAIAKTMQTVGFKVIITGTGDQPPRGLDFEYLSVDFSKPQSLSAFLSNLKTFKIDVLVNNAGINMIAPYESIEEADFDQIQRVNMKAPFQITQTVLPHMKNKRWGRVVNIASIFSQISKAHRASYSTSKFGLDGLTTALAVEVAEFGILANCVSPGFIKTNMTESLNEEQKKTIIDKIPLGMIGSPNDVANCVEFLASEESRYITGETIHVNGGMAML